MRLWTWQHPDWDLTSQEWSPHVGEEMWGRLTWEPLKRLYPRLREILHMRAFVWCYLHYEHWKKSELRMLWVLNVPENHVRFLNSIAWEGLLYQKFDQMSEEDAWSRLIVSKKTEDDLTALVPLPILREWVEDRAKFNKGIDVSNAPYDELPDSVEAAQTYRLASKLRKKTP